MTFVGKILTVLIVVLSFAWLGLAAAVYSTHRNWYEYAIGDGKGGKPSLRMELETKKEENAKLALERMQLENELQSEKTTRRLMIAKADAARQLDMKTIADSTANLDKATKAATEQATANAATQAMIKSLNDEIATIRETLKTTREELDKTFGTMVTVTDRVHQLQLVKIRLEEQARVLADQARKMSLVLAAHGLKADDPVDGAAPRGGEVVTSVKQDGSSVFVTVSLGEDDGIRKGHQMNVYRGDKFVGRITITSVNVNRSIGVSEPRFYVAPFQVGDKTETITLESAAKPLPNVR